MTTFKSQDCLSIISALVRHAHCVIGQGFVPRWQRLTIQKIVTRTRSEGLGFLTKTLPSLGKAFDKALSGQAPLDATVLRFKTKSGSKLPILFGELFERCLSLSGDSLPIPDAECVAFLRQVLYLFYKYELPYDRSQEDKVIQAFLQAEDDLVRLTPTLKLYAEQASKHINESRREPSFPSFEINSLSEGLGYPTRSPSCVVREARILLSRVLSDFDFRNILPRHGPGVVSTRQRDWNKYQWTNISKRITEYYPIDEYFYSSLGHVCDTYDSFSRITEHDLPAQVILVPKDSRGPRLISCEPVDFQWIQQGISRSLVRTVESHFLSKGRVNFTDQTVNRDLALSSSKSGEFVTLDLKEASDRIHVDLVRLLFPEHISNVLLACRSTSTTLPDGRIVPLTKYAPMGSALCFPILALCVWSILHGAACDEHVKNNVFVYGDDVIVPKHYAMCAIRQLETFGLLVNRDKSCLQGLFRESCGMDALNGIDVTPVRLRTVWTSTPQPETYASWVSYHNSFYERKLYRVCSVIRSMLLRVYRNVPSSDESNLSAPGIFGTSIGITRRRWNPNLYRFEYRLRSLHTMKRSYPKDCWISLLRYFSEHCLLSTSGLRFDLLPLTKVSPEVDLGVYTQRRRVKFKFVWK